MRIPLWIAIALALLALASLSMLAIAALRRRVERDRRERPEEMLLEEAVVSEPLAPGMEGKAVIRRGSSDQALRIRAVDGAQAFPRGTRVRILDYSDGAYLVESADEEHLVH
jgi:membrane protein implicated in regulation of membrane protease activity